MWRRMRLKAACSRAAIDDGLSRLSSRAVHRRVMTDPNYVRFMHQHHDRGRAPTLSMPSPGRRLSGRVAAPLRMSRCATAPIRSPWMAARKHQRHPLVRWPTGSLLERRSSVSYDIAAWMIYAHGPTNDRSPHSTQDPLAADFREDRRIGWCRASPSTGMRAARARRIPGTAPLSGHRWRCLLASVRPQAVA